ncbi:MAG: mechanosensitive ion channel protein MscS [Gammaproteobacteria bacterium RBG_16_57_12]|nr:MAG: mechanosensitive ion channel protein MscS [Gammaproteobacteria bacterium RBG_16_57_12]
MKLEQLWADLEAMQAEAGWLTEVIVVAAVILTANFALSLLLNRLYVKSQATTNPWDDAIIDALRKPLALLVWIIGIAFAIYIVHSKTQATILEAAGPIRNVGIIACFAWFLIRFIKGVEKNVIERRQQIGMAVDKVTVDALGKVLRVSVIIIATLVTLQTLGFSISGVLAFGGIGGLAVGLAAKDLLANFFGGLMIYLDRPFTIGDTVRSPDRNIEGTVEHIGWRLTHIRTPDKRPLYVPNAVFTTITVENTSRMSHRHINEIIGIRYSDLDKMQPIVTAIRELLSQQPGIDTSQKMMVNFTSFGPSSLDILVHAFTFTTEQADFQNLKQEILLGIADIIARHGAEIAFPTTTVHLPDAVILKETRGTG